MRNAHPKRDVLARGIACGGLFFLFCVLLIVGTNRGACEWAARNFTAAWVYVVGHITAAVPFSVFEVGCYLLAIGVAAVLILTIVDLCRRRGLRALKRLMNLAVLALTLLTVYYATAGLAYKRAAVPVPAAAAAEVTEEGMERAGIAFYEAFNADADALTKNAVGESVSPYTFEEAAELVRAQYARLTDDYLPAYVPRPKKIASGWLMSQFHIIGITFVPTGEANVNGAAPMQEQVFTMAHELAHTLGVMREHEANLLAAYVLLNADDPYLRYCGFVETQGEMNLAMTFANRGETLKQLSAPSCAKADRINSVNFWGSYTVLDDVGEFFNNVYLKLNGQKDGTNSYFQQSGGDRFEDESGNIYYENVVYSDMQRMLYKMFSA